MEKGLHALRVEGRDAWVMAVGDVPASGARVVYMPAGEDFPDELAAVRPLLEDALRAGRCRPFVLAAFASGDWNRDYSPWPAQGLTAKGDAFAGEAGATLGWLREAYLPVVERDFPTGERCLMGYSLAGLFALWALCQDAPFMAVASCSGSLWYDGWVDHLCAHMPRSPCHVYMSLGDREGRARNPRMATVEEATRRTAARLEASPNVRTVALEWNAGGHFTDVPGRLARAMCWLSRAGA